MMVLLTVDLSDRLKAVKLATDMVLKKVEQTTERSVMQMVASSVETTDASWVETLVAWMVE
jgi:hypothetical protein